MQIYDKSRVEFVDSMQRGEEEHFTEDKSWIRWNREQNDTWQYYCAKGPLLCHISPVMLNVQTYGREEWMKPDRVFSQSRQPFQDHQSYSHEGLAKLFTENITA